MGKRRLKFYSSHEEQEWDDLMRAYRLSPEERMREMRQLINLAYGMKGVDMNNPPTKHKLTFRETPDYLLSE